MVELEGDDMIVINERRRSEVDAKKAASEARFEVYGLVVKWLKLIVVIGAVNASMLAINFINIKNMID